MQIHSTSRRLLGGLSLAALVAAFPVPSAIAWDHHDVLRRVALGALPELDALADVPVTPMTLTPTGINPAVDFGFVGPGPGETQHPRDILAGYAMEPDWGMDQELNASWQQRFMGGYTGVPSQGYFHMYYPSVTLHLPIPVTSMGAAPRRAEQWMGMSIQSFVAGDSYWGWRYAAWALHYLEDVSQPFHSTQTHRKFIRWRSPIKGSTNCTANFHFLFEHWLGRRLNEEVAGEADFGLVAALRGELDGPVEPVADAVRRSAKTSHKAFGGLGADCIEYFGDRFVSSERVHATEADLEKVEPGPVLDRILAVSRTYFRLAGASVRRTVRRVMAREGLGAPTTD